MKKEKIFIVEDERGMREALVEAFNKAGYPTLVAADGEEAVEKAMNEDFDLVLLDIILPRKDGFEVLLDLKKEEKTKDKPVILCTNLSQPYDIQKALDAGATTYLVKANYSLEGIVEKVEEVLKNQG